MRAKRKKNAQQQLKRKFVLPEKYAEECEKEKKKEIFSSSAKNTLDEFHWIFNLSCELIMKREKNNSLTEHEYGEFSSVFYSLFVRGLTNSSS